MNVKELKEKLSKIPDDSVQIFCAEILPFTIEETDETKSLINPIKAYPVEKIAFSTEYDSKGNGKRQILFGVEFFRAITDSDQTSIIELLGEQ